MEFSLAGGNSGHSLSSLGDWQQPRAVAGFSLCSLWVAELPEIRVWAPGNLLFTADVIATDSFLTVQSGTKGAELKKSPRVQRSCWRGGSLPAGC